MAVGSRAHHLLISNNKISHYIALPNRRALCGCLSSVPRWKEKSAVVFKDLVNIYCFNRYISISSRKNTNVRLTPQEVTSLLRENEFTKEFLSSGSVKSYDSNQLLSNNPIEDTRSEAQCLLTTGLLLGVFDGHGGPACAHVAAKRMLHYIAVCLLPPDALRKYLDAVDKKVEIKLLDCFNENIELIDDLKVLYERSFRTFVKELSEQTARREFHMKDAMEQAFLRLDDDISREATPEGGSKVDARTMSVAMSGAVSCVAHVDGPHLHLASVGDCQAVLGVLSDVGAWTAKKLSVEHNTDNQSEVSRILSEHPPGERDTVIRMDRLLGQLAPLRALGDHRYKWGMDKMRDLVVPHLGEKAVPPNYHTPPYLTARPEVVYHHLTPRDKFLVLATDGLWDLVSPLQAVRLVGEHMSGKVTLSPFRLPRKNMRIVDINQLLLQRKEGLAKKPVDTNAATHLLRNALGGTEYGMDHGKLSHILSLPDELVRLFRDDITITVVYFDSEFLRHCPP
ncbi:pyruvate dehydrogenase [acetyl-transferring]-phosphatase 1, mitochondrial isoform X2 [Bacillus rossius redtenbacheri]|uniref:pyruvate dehydrogenase [acetyl-transferring]-phosphatase 1, mitochondrial isoform X2 n=1 Tax=Bacillus rossius redtenbacheri TaxID=93214 RepID=UPI002FDD9374